MVEARYRFTGRCVTGSRPAEPDPRVAPNFSLREFARQDGSYFIHPNLILILQNLRNILIIIGWPSSSKNLDLRPKGVLSFT